MTLDDFDRVERAARASIVALLHSWFPNGKTEGNEFCIGSRAGEEGRSMRIRLRGEKEGFWSDFSSSEAGRDLISLYAYIHDLRQGQACKALADDLGIPISETPPGSAQQKTKKPTPAPAAQGVEMGAKKPRTEWVPILPVPENAGPYPVAHVVRGRPERQWAYRDQRGKLLGVISRFVTSTGGKEILPCVFAQHAGNGKSEWRWMAFPEPRPLYLTAPLRDGFPVVVVEGEKCADAAFALIGGVFNVVSWPGGSNAISKVDWSPLAGRKVILWADCDGQVYKRGHQQAGQLMPEAEQPGMKAMVNIASILKPWGGVVQFVDIPAPGSMPNGYDVADLIAVDNADIDTVLRWVHNIRYDDLEYESAEEIEEEVLATDAMPDWVSAPPDTTTPSPAGARSGDVATVYNSFHRTNNGGIKGCRENVFYALHLDEDLQGLVGFDKFSQLQYKRRDTPWASEAGEWTEQDDFSLGLYLANRYGFVVSAIGDIEKGVAQAARLHAYNPVTEYMDRCADGWDGVARVETAFSTYWGATDSEYMRLISTMFFVGLAKRAYFPGVKHDHAPVFEGGQGAGKSTALAILGGDWFADTPFRMGDKDGYLSIQGVLIYEVAELEQFNRSETTAIKAFMSSTTDRYREPYGRRMKNKPRTAVFAATTNEGEYFKDTTGNRRFWPVLVGLIMLEQLRHDRDHLIGEAVHRMRRGDKWYPTGDQQTRLIHPEQESREIADPWLGRIYDYLEGKDADGKLLLNRIDSVTARDLLTKALHIEIGKLGPAKQETMRIAACMRKLGWAKERETSGARERFYVRPKVVVPAIKEEGDVDLPL